MNGRMITALMLAGALASGAAAAFFANGYIDKAVAERRAQLDSQYQPVRAIVASNDLAPGTFISADTVSVREVPKAFVHSDVVLAEHFERVAGRLLIHPLKSGETVLLSHLAREAAAGFSSTLKPGMRALTFPVNDESSISGMLAPGDRIDLFFTTTNNNDSLIIPLLYDVPVIATGIRTISNAAYLEGKESGYQTITVSVTPENAAKITLAQEAGKLTVALRQPQDDSTTTVARLTKTALVQTHRPIKHAVAKFPIEIILGGK